MSNLIQESPEPQIPKPPFDSRFSTLTLNPAAVDDGNTHHHHRHHNTPPCSSCGRRPPRSAATPLKRRSPTPFQNPTSKRPFLDLTSFSKIDLPFPFGSSSSLQRSVSDPTEARNFSPPPPLRRTASNPIPSPDKAPESPIIIGRIKDSIKDNDSPDSKRLKRIKDRLKEMNQWLNGVVSEDEEDDRDSNKKEEEEDDEETVRVQRIGDSLELRLKCPCGKGFEILLSGTSCFYKLL